MKTWPMRQLAHLHTRSHGFGYERELWSVRSITRGRAKWLRLTS